MMACHGISHLRRDVNISCSRAFRDARALKNEGGGQSHVTWRCSCKIDNLLMAPLVL